MSSAFRSVATGNYNSGAGPTLTIAKPAGTINGDVLVAAFLGNDNGTVSTLGGWTSVFNINTNWAKRRQMFWKVASGEGASYAWTSTADACGGIIACISGTSGLKDADANLTNTASLTVTGPAFTTAKDDETIVWVGFRNVVSSGGVAAVSSPASLGTRAVGSVGAVITEATLWLAAGQFPTAGALPNGFKNGGVDEAVQNMAAIITFLPPSVSGSMFLGSL
jgi:hypothetical protein